MERVKKFILPAIKIALIIVLVIIFNLFMMPKYITENQDGRIVAELNREKLSADVIFLGSSTVYSGISPVSMYNKYGFTSFDCANSSQTLWISLCMLKEALKYNNPSLVVLDIGFGTVEDDYAEEVSNRKAFDYMRYDKIRHDGIESAMHESESIWSYYLPVLRYHERYKYLSSEDLKYLFYKPTVTYNGYIMNTLIANELPESIEMSDIDAGGISERNAKCLQEIIDICKKNNIDILLIKTPSYNPKWGDKYESDIQSIADRNEITYINFDNYTDEIGIDWSTDTPDSGRHLNLYGAEKFSAFIGSFISDNYSVADRRNQDEYKSVWDKKTARYKEDAYKSVNAIGQ